MVDAGEERREGAQHGDEAAEEHDLAAVPEKQVLPELEPALVEAEIAAVAVDDGEAEFPPDPVAAIVADDGAGRRRADDAPEVKLSLCPARIAAATSTVSPGIGIPALSMPTMTKIAR